MYQHSLPERNNRVQKQNRITISNNLILALALTVLLAMQEGAQSERPLHFLTKQCNEDVIQVHLDPRPFQDLVGSDFSVVLEEGKARVQILVQDCSEYWIDGENLGPNQEIHVWLLINGLRDVRPVVGAKQTRPTMTWLSLFDGSTNPQAREARMAAGSVQVPIESVFLDPPGPERGGRVTFSRNLTYSWDVVSEVPLVRLLGVNHDIYTKDSAGNIFLNQIQALLHVFSTASRGTLEVVGRTDMLPLINIGTYPVLVNTFFPMWTRGTLGILPSR
jgi:hypothetical protein